MGSTTSCCVPATPKVHSRLEEDRAEPELNLPPQEERLRKNLQHISDIENMDGNVNSALLNELKKAKETKLTE